MFSSFRNHRAQASLTISLLFTLHNLTFFIMAHSKPIESLPIAERLTLKDEQGKAKKKKKRIVTNSGFVKLDLDTTLYVYPVVDRANAHASLNIKRQGLSKIKVALSIFSKKFVLDWYQRTVEKSEVHLQSKNSPKMRHPLVNFKKVDFLSHSYQICNSFFFVNLIELILFHLGFKVLGSGALHLDDRDQEAWARGQTSSRGFQTSTREP